MPDSPCAPTGTPTAAADDLAARLAAVRARTLALAEGLSAEDMVVQSMPDASPVKWHLAHTTWFLEVFVLGPHAGLRPLRPEWHYLFNSYYEAAGPRHPRPERGLLTRPAVAEVVAWRREVEERLARFLATGAATPAAMALVELGINHEQQHQELILTDLKHLLSCNPLAPVYRSRAAGPDQPVPRLGWQPHAGGLVRIGWEGAGFAFDNEGPRHTVWLEPFEIADRPVTCGEFQAFMADGGYRDPTWWLSDGWAAVRSYGWEAPGYWRREPDGGWTHFTLAGERPVNPAEPVCHLSFYEADAFARWAAQQWPGARLPTEAEWEVAAAAAAPAGGFADTDRFHPDALSGPSWYGQVWEWTGTAYRPYPGFHPAGGAVGEYNGKFMSGQMVLRGGSCATPAGHVRATYRNFFPPGARWQFSGLRLARDSS